MDSQNAAFWLVTSLCVEVVLDCVRERHLIVGGQRSFPAISWLRIRRTGFQRDGRFKSNWQRMAGTLRWDYSIRCFYLFIFKWNLFGWSESEGKERNNVYRLQYLFYFLIFIRFLSCWTENVALGLWLVIFGLNVEAETLWPLKWQW